MKSIARNQSLTERKRKPLSIEPIVFHTINYILLAGLCVFMLYPMLNTLAISFNDGLDAVRGGIGIWPRVFSLQNYQTVFRMSTLITAFRVTVMRTLVQTFANLVVTSMLAYALSRKEYIFRRPIAIIFVITMYFHAGLIPHFILVQSLGLLDSFHVYWIPTMISAFNLIILRTYMRSIPEALTESAKLDGASDFRIYWQIIMPLTKPALATIALFVAVGAWNSWFDAFIFNGGSPHLSVLQFELQRLLSSAMMAGQTGGQAAAAAQAGLGLAMVTPQSLRAAVAIVASVPILLVYPFLQRYFVHGVQLGGVKE